MTQKMNKPQVIDLRSDTVTRPTAAMLQAMQAAAVGDDVYGEDPTVNLLQEKLANMFGFEAGIFCPSGTMTNQIAIRCLTNPGEEVICHRLSHIYNYEGGGIAVNSLCSVRLIESPEGTISPEDVLENLNPSDSHFARTSVLALENTVNKAGGTIFPMELMRQTCLKAREKGLRLHLDGARLFNALVETGENPTELGQLFDTVSICLSKGLGAPVGSVLLASRQMIAKAHRYRKLMGGGMRQVGYLAAAGLYALEHNIERLVEDHQRAKSLAQMLHSKAKSLVQPQTNILIFEIQTPSQDFVHQAAELGLLCNSFGPNRIRLVTHLDFDDEQLQACERIFKQLKF
jgi:threonine aldolase